MSNGHGDMERVEPCPEKSKEMEMIAHRANMASIDTV